MMIRQQDHNDVISLDFEDLTAENNDDDDDDGGRCCWRLGLGLSVAISKFCKNNQQRHHHTTYFLYRALN